jgi:hypothetical protein
MTSTDLCGKTAIVTGASRESGWPRRKHWPPPSMRI